MCGITVILQHRYHSARSVPASSVWDAIGTRGLNAWNVIQRTTNDWNIWIYASTLGLRGDDVTVLPVEDPNGDALGWNGEAWVEEITGGDSSWVLSKLKSRNGVLKTMDAIPGPWAMVYWEERTKTLWWGRDRMGRRSLIKGGNVQDGLLWVSSVVLQIESDGLSGAEVDPSGIWYFDGVQGSVGVELREFWELEVIPERTPRGAPKELALAKRSFLVKEIQRGLDRSFQNCSMDHSQARFGQALRKAVSTRMNGLGCNDRLKGQRIGVLFSGGLDSMVLARFVLEMEIGDGKSLTVELINVSFGEESFDSPDRRSAIDGYEELKRIAEHRRNVQIDLILVDVTGADARENELLISRLIFPCDTPMDYSIGTALWFAARGQGRNYDTKRTGIKNFPE